MRLLTAGKKYQVIFKVQLADGAEVSVVKQKLMEIFKTTQERVEKLLSSNHTIISQNLEEQAAKEYAEKLQSIGLLCSVEPMPEVFIATPPKPQAQQQKQQFT